METQAFFQVIGGSGAHKFESRSVLIRKPVTPAVKLVEKLLSVVVSGACTLSISLFARQYKTKLQLCSVLSRN